MMKDERLTELLNWSQERKKQDRENLSKMAPADAQTKSELILNPKFARVADGELLDWSGDLGDDWEPECE